MERIVDSNGWPIAPGAWIKHLRRKGEVLKVEASEQHPEGIVTYRDAKTLGERLASAPTVTVMAAGSASQDRYERELAIPAPDLPDPDDCTPREHLEQGIHLPILDRIDARVHPDQAVAGAGERAEVSGWIRFADDRPVDAASLILLADAFPPSIFTLLGRIGWVPTLELTVHVRRRPAAGWIKAHLATTDLHNGLLIEDVLMWDEDDRLVAQARQLALLSM